MTSLALTPLLIALLPVLVFLGALVYFDGYKLVSLRWVLVTMLVGGLCAGASYLFNAVVLDFTGISLTALSRYVAPVSEEVIKALILVYLLRTNRIGFLVDAGIFGFAVGSGFAIVENIYYLHTVEAANTGVWIVRGFGTAIMHGGVSAIFAVTAAALSETQDDVRPVNLLPGLMMAILTHSLFNHFFLAPILSTMVIITILPVLSYVVIQQSEGQVSRWLDVGFDADAELLGLIRSGEISGSPVGKYLNSLRTRFPDMVVVDMFCYLRLHKELALRAKGMLMMRENGFDVEVDEQVEETLVEMKALQKQIGRTGQVAMRPLLRISRKDLWQLFMLEQ